MNMVLCLSHPLTDEQILDAQQQLGITRFIEMPDNLATGWKQVPPEPDVPLETLTEVLAFLGKKTAAGDYVLVQGEFGMTCAVVDWCNKNSRIPVYATTIRDYRYEMKPDGTVVNTHTFRHVRFRRYFNCNGSPL